MKEQLFEQAIKMRDRANAPYSDYKVGSAVLTKSDKIFGADLYPAPFAQSKTILIPFKLKSLGKFFLRI